MFSTGAIGLWSILEEGIGIIAGSLPALRPLLSLPAAGGKDRDTGSSSANTNPLVPNAAPSFQSTKYQQQQQKPGSLRPQTHTRQASNTFRLNVLEADSENSHRTGGWGRKSRPGSTKDDYDDDDDDDDDNDGDSQKQIVKEVHVRVEAEDLDQTASDDWVRQQVLGWDTERRSSRAVHVPN